MSEKSQSSGAAPDIWEDMLPMPGDPDFPVSLGAPALQPIAAAPPRQGLSAEVRTLLGKYGNSSSGDPADAVLLAQLWRCLDDHGRHAPTRADTGANG